MAKPGDTTLREERLAAKLRENLHRRKAQARAQAPASEATGRNAAENDLENDSAALPIVPPES